MKGSLEKRMNIKPITLLTISLMLILLWACAPGSSPVEPEAKKASQIASIQSEKLDSKVGDSIWRADWERSLKEAKSEGRVVVYGPPIAETRRGFTEAFQKAYPGITMEYTGLAGAQVAPKITAERRAGIYMVDVHIGGTTTILTSLRQFAAPIKAFLILPEVKDPKAWMEDRLDFSDDAGKINLVFTIEGNSRVIYNSDLVNPGELGSYWDLTKPKWIGKINMRDPRVSGMGLAVATFWYLQPQLGLDYLKSFAAIKPLLTRDSRFQLESVARGRDSMTIAPDTSIAMEFQKAGMPIKFAKIMKEGTYSTANFGSVIVMDKAPHPYAARVFLNWMLSKEGQTVWTTTSGLASRRLDAPLEHIPEELQPNPGVSYLRSYKEEIVMKKDEIVEYLNQIFAGF